MRTTAFPLPPLLVPLLLNVTMAWLVAPVLPAQGVTTQPRNWRKTKVREQVEEMRNAMREGRIVRYNVQVKVRLKNGNRLKGIVRNGRFIEKHDGLDFVVTDRHSEHAGLRLWYYNGTNSYIFLPHAMIAHYKLGLRMSDREVMELEKRLVAAERKRREMEQQLAEERRRKMLAGKTPGGPPEQKKVEQTPGQGTGLTADQLKLLQWLQDYPPEKGWGKKKLQSLQMRRITVGVYPNKEEKRFEDNFETWQKALQLKEKLDGQKPPSAGSATGSQGSVTPPGK